MNNLNSIIIEGNLKENPVFSKIEKGKSLCTFPLKTSRFFKKDEEVQEEVSFFDIETWARLAEVCNDHLIEGRGVRIVGRIKQDRWTDKDGNERSRVKIVAEHVEFKPEK